MYLLMGKDRNCKKKVVRKPEPKPKKERTNYLEKEARYLTRNYTNELIRKQIENDNFLFFFYILSLVVAAILIFVVGGEGGLVFGLSIVVITFLLMIISGTFNMPKHIRPSCSGKRYTPQEIDAMANDPETIWHNDIRVFVTPKTLIGLNKGITVVDYDDIESIKSQKRWHTSKMSSASVEAKKFGNITTYTGRRPDRYNVDWYTYVVKIKTHSGKRLTLSESYYEDVSEMLTEIVEKKRSSQSIQ